MQNMIKFISDHSTLVCLKVYSIQPYIHVQYVIKFISDNSTLAWEGVLNTKCIKLIGDTSTHVCI